MLGQVGQRDYVDCFRLTPHTVCLVVSSFSNLFSSHSLPSFVYYFPSVLTHFLLDKKSTYCRAMQDHAATHRRTMHVANLDPAAELFQYDAAFDVRDLISVEEVMDELGLGPNGALVYCMEFLLENLDWLQDELENFMDDEYLLLDCPGQLELYTHIPVMKQVLDRMKQWGYDGSMVSVFCVDSAFVIEAGKFISGSLLSLSAMVAMELPHVTILTKCDLLEDDDVECILDYGSASHLWHVDQDRRSLLSALNPLDDSEANDAAQTRFDDEMIGRLEERRRQRDRLTYAIAQLLDDWQMVSFAPLNINSEDSLEHVYMLVSHAIQYGEDLEVKGAENYDDIPDEDNES